jgi:hypothetical protein
MTTAVDLRGFAYPLEPLRRKQQWRVDALQAKLALAMKSLGQARQERDAAAAELAACAQQMRQRSGGALDPAAYARQLAYLIELQAGVERRTQQVEQRAHERQAVKDEYVEAQRSVDVTNAHREECMKEYIVYEQNRMNGEVDREWLARDSQARAARVAAGSAGQ